ncbi:MAG TPA: hypothetical protein VG692_04285 [Gemmatimonadales bacterium]|nr:hypothetical protein [Gemmatimonadales bacterium]
MRRHAGPAVLGLALLGAGPLAAQIAVGNGGVAQVPFAYKVNFAIPDAPAFELLQVDQSTILRPQTARELGVAVASFVDDQGDITLPRAFAVEFSPGLLVAQQGLSAATASRARFLYHLRLSAAALRDSAGDGTARVALGLRFTVADEADLRPDRAFPDSLRVTGITEKILAIYRAARLRVGPTQPIELTKEEEQQIAGLNQEIRDRWAERYWNAGITDVALAARLAPADSAGGGTRFDAWSLWGTVARGIGRWGQFLIGVRAGLERDRGVSDYVTSGSIASRFYAGRNRLKGYAELQGTMVENAKADVLVNSGLEFALVDWLWADVSAGLESPGGSSPSRLVTHVKLKTGVPGF